MAVRTWASNEGVRMLPSSKHGGSDALTGADSGFFLADVGGADDEVTGVAGRFHVEFFADFLSDLTVVFWGCLYFSWDDGFLGGGKMVG